MKYLILLLIFSLASCFAQENNFTVMTYNIHHGEGIDKVLDIERIGNLIIDNSVDLAGLQEVDKGVTRSNKFDIMEMLASQTKMFSVFQKNIDVQGGDYGNGILSKYKIDSVKNHHFTKIQEGETRGLLQIFTKINNQPVVFITTHIDYKIHDSEKLLNVSEIENEINGYKDLPIIFCGDFNDFPESVMYNALKNNFIDVWTLLNKDDKGFTFPADKPDRRIDYIYISKEGLKKFKPVKINVINSEASDHLPLIAEFEVLE